jgi:nucleoside diphosphate kinase
MIKPDGVQRNLVAPILERFLAKGYILRGLKFMNVSKSLAETHYSDLSAKPFFGGALLFALACCLLILLAGSRSLYPLPVQPWWTTLLAALWSPSLWRARMWWRRLVSHPCCIHSIAPPSGRSQLSNDRSACLQARKLIGATNPLASAPGTIRGDYSIEIGYVQVLAVLAAFNVACVDIHC